VEAPAPTVAASKAKLPSKAEWIAATLPISSPWLAENDRHGFERTQDSTPPPLDTVVVYLHLTI
jgi:hypothetical protein